VTAASGKTILLTPAQITALKNLNNVRNVSLVAEEKALLQNQDYQAIIELKGVDSNYTKVTTVEQSLVRGKFLLGNAQQPGAVMGVGIENAVAILSDRAIGALTVYLPKKGVADLSNPLASFNEGKIVPNGAFAVEQGFDNKYVLTNLDFVRQNMDFKPDEYTAAEIALVNTDDEKITRARVEQLLGPGYTVQTRYEQNSSLYHVMRLEKYAIFGIFILVLIVAAFNMIGALSMLVLEKQKDIQILQSMGATQSWIQRVFLTEGMVLAAIGAGIGIILALTLCFLQLQFRLIPLEGTSFIIDYYPVKLVFTDFLIVAATVFIIAITASWLPSKRAAAQAFELRN
jgi:lipoprotein-releasing system permease protein